MSVIFGCGRGFRDGEDGDFRDEMENSASESAAESYSAHRGLEDEAFLAELYSIYDEFLASGEKFSMSTLEEEESVRLTGGNSYYVNGHL